MPIDIDEKATEILEDGFCILRDHYPRKAVTDCFDAFLPTLLEFVEANRENPNRGPERHYITLPFKPPLYNQKFFFDETVLAIVKAVLGEKVLIDQFASDTPLQGSDYQKVHADVPLLFPEQPDLFHPPLILAVNFSFIDITPEMGPFEVARGTHKIPREETIQKTEAGDIPLEPLLLNAGDLLIRDPRCLHRGTPNRTDTPRPVAVFSFIRGWYYRNREKNLIPSDLWESFTDDQKDLMQRLKPS